MQYHLKIPRLPLGINAHKVSRCNQGPKRLYLVSNRLYRYNLSYLVNKLEYSLGVFSFFLDSRGFRGANFYWYSFLARNHLKHVYRVKLHPCAKSWRRYIFFFRTPKIELFSAWIPDPISSYQICG